MILIELSRSMSPILKKDFLKKANRKEGFSLIEILIVIALIAVIAGLAISNLGGIFGGQQEKAAQIFVSQSLKIPLTAYKIDMGTYTSTEEGLKALIQAPSGKSSKWKKPYIEELPTDPWGNAYQYRYPGSKNVNGNSGDDVWSFGPDGSESVDDIGNW